MSESDKIKALDDMILQADQLKDMVLSEVSKLTDKLSESFKKMGEADPAKLKNSFASLKSFLESSSNIMDSLNKQVKELNQEVTKLKTYMDQVGMMCK